MSKKTFNLVTACIGGVQTIAVAVVTYCVKDATIATAVSSSLVIVGTAAIEICSKFVKD